MDHAAGKSVGHRRSTCDQRGFYLHFDGKHELLLALFEDTLFRTADQIRAAATGRTEPLDRLQVAIRLLFELCRPDPSAQRPLFTDFAPQLLTSYPTEVRTAHAPLLDVLTELLTEVGEADKPRPEVEPRRTAALIMQTVMFNAHSSGTEEDTDRPSPPKKSGPSAPTESPAKHERQ